MDGGDGVVGHADSLAGEPPFLGDRMEHNPSRLTLERYSVVNDYGTVTVRGFEVDIDAAVARQPAQEPERDMFVKLVKLAESHA